ncbi:MAG: quinoprotein relay system zinc metallohydrolase 2 [Acetobacteraceae bacterium]|nr:quinoprotein relay system zinc metallohydrolase 2 [Acetobacteraceae bacterium]
MRRRQALQLAAACALPRWGHAAPTFATTEVAPGIHVRQGVHEEATVENQDGIANIGFIVGDRTVAVIDPGGSRADGEGLRGRIHAVTDRPISHVIMTHLHPDHVFGAGAFAPDQPVFVAHARMEPMLVTRGEFYRNRLADILGIEEAGDYAKPGMLVQDTVSIDLGGRNLVLQGHPTAHTDNDLSILDEKTATLWMGDLLFVDRVPALDGSILGWLAVTRALRDSKARAAVPGHGPPLVPWPAAASAQERYLGLLVREIRAIIARGGDIEEAVASVGASERPNWLLFDDYNGRNVTAAFKELEWE